MAQRVASIDAAIADPGGDPDKISPLPRNRYLEAALDEGNPSKPLRAFLEALLARPRRRRRRKRPNRQRGQAHSRGRCRRPERKLRIYALDPSVAKRLDSVSVHEATLIVPWDDQPATAEPLRPARSASISKWSTSIRRRTASMIPSISTTRCCLRRTDCRRRKAIRSSTSRWSMPSRMTTDRPFRARARPPRAVGAALRRRKGADGAWRYEVPRLRIYPHGLRTDNAYYSPDKKALLFGYFPSESKDDDTTTPGIDGVLLPVQRHRRP